MFLKRNKAIQSQTAFADLLEFWQKCLYVRWNYSIIKNGNQMEILLILYGRFSFFVFNWQYIYNEKYELYYMYLWFIQSINYKIDVIYIRLSDAQYNSLFRKWVCIAETGAHKRIILYYGQWSEFLKNRFWYGCLRLSLLKFIYIILVLKASFL